MLLVAVGTLLVGGFGLWLVHLTGLSCTTGWIDWATGLFIVALALGALGGWPARRARKLAVRLADQGVPATAELRALPDDRPALLLDYASLLVLIAILGLMVFKP